jgi:hypothetical protein
MGWCDGNCFEVGQAEVQWWTFRDHIKRLRFCKNRKFLSSE